MMKPTDNHQEHLKGQSFDAELDRFFGAAPVSAPSDYTGSVCRRVKTRAFRTKCAVRASICGIAAAVILAVVMWSGIAPTEHRNVVGVEENGGEFYTEVHMLEEILVGAEALGNEDVLDTLDLLLGG
jgi:hypothetical protein